MLMILLPSTGSLVIALLIGMAWILVSALDDNDGPDNPATT